ncbi:SMC-Scp complex subunit ScpB [Rhodopseudomonas sp. HC1]|uniref:SMC-Scp complex subunit ScpB n=1 Tax=Rhodopseudomonas infernalis TaxID=2897386 RepID=UPI001EE8B264|nr:SMC-Scp complex subunit ScpB [Rhodopseudomonas infernalis]MCG6205911.1 SMC-Scp complex subunit ScpB [Rhodopseudomonas infernalis]
MASLAEKRIVEFEPKLERDEVVTEQQPQSRPEELRLLEALLFASPEPLEQAALAKRMPEGVDIKAALAQLQADYAHRGVNLVRIASKWTFRTAGDLAWLMTRETTETRKLSRAAIEMLAIIAYHQPITRAEIEEIRGVVTSKGTLDVLLETGWIRPRGRRKTPGRPLTFGTTDAFLAQFSLEALSDLPGLEELKGSGLLDTRLPTGFSVPTPSDDPTLREDEDPLEGGELDLALAPLADPETDEAPPAEASADHEQPEGETAVGVAEAAAEDSAELETGFAETSEDEGLDTEVGFVEAGDVVVDDDAATGEEAASEDIVLADADDSASDDAQAAAFLGEDETTESALEEAGLESFEDEQGEVEADEAGEPAADVPDHDTSDPDAVGEEADESNADEAEDEDDDQGREPT